MDRRPAVSLFCRSSLVALSLVFAGSLVGCGDPPVAVPTTPPGVAYTPEPPKYEPGEGPAALGESAYLDPAESESMASVQLKELPALEETGIEVTTLEEGRGDEVAELGDTVSMRYTGTLESGKEFDSNAQSTGKPPFTFTLGTGQVIEGWDIGVQGMKVGETRKLVIPAKYGYGRRGTGPIPPGATLIFEVELLEITK